MEKFFVIRFLQNTKFLLFRTEFQNSKHTFVYSVFHVIFVKLADFRNYVTCLFAFTVTDGPMLQQMIPELLSQTSEVMNTFPQNIPNLVSALRFSYRQLVNIGEVHLMQEDVIITLLSVNFPFCDRDSNLLNCSSFYPKIRTFQSKLEKFLKPELG